jgi:hypothetical protein
MGLLCWGYCDRRNSSGEVFLGIVHVTHRRKDVAEGFVGRSSGQHFELKAAENGEYTNRDVWYKQLREDRPQCWSCKKGIYLACFAPCERL